MRKSSLPLGSSASEQPSSEESRAGSDSISLGKFLLVILLLSSSLLYLVFLNANLRADMNNLRETELANSQLQKQLKSHNAFYSGTEGKARELQTTPSDGASELPGLVTSTIFDQDNEINKMKKEIEILKGLVQAPGQVVSVDKSEVDIYSYVNPNNGNATLSVKAVGSDKQNVLIDTSSTTASQSPNIILGDESQRVGVGQRAPAAELHVNGHTLSEGVVVKGSASVDQVIKAKKVSIGSLATNDDNGFVGIGVDTAEEALHVGGDMRVSGQLNSQDLRVINNMRVLQSTDLGKTILGSSAVLGGVKVDPLDSGSPKVLIDKNGRMLVNKVKTGELSAELEVGGLVKASDVEVQVADQTVLGILKINKDGKVGANVAPSQDFDLNVLGDFALKGNLKVTPDTAVKIGNVNIDSNSVGIKVPAAALDGVEVSGNVQTDSDLKVAVNLKSKIGGLEVNKDGKVGIGTIPAGTPNLSVKGNVKVIGDLTNAPDSSTTMGPLKISKAGYVGLNNADPKKALDVVGDVFVLGDAFMTVKSKSNIGNLNFLSSGKVAVGSTTPDKTFHVEGNVKGWSDIFVDTSVKSNIGDLRIFPTKVGLSKDPVKDFEVEGKAHIREGISVKVASQSQFISVKISADGKVGINQAPGSNRLEVTGDTYVVKDLFVRTKSESVVGPITIKNSGLVGIGRSPFNETLEVEGSMKLIGNDINVIGRERSYIEDVIFLKDNVGINKEPEMELDILGDMASTGNLVADMASTESSYIKPLWIVKNALYSRIGINTEKPESELHVVGDARFEGNTIVDNYQRSQVGNMLHLDNGVQANGVGGVGIGSNFNDPTLAIGAALSVTGNMEVTKDLKIIDNANIGEVYSIKDSPTSTRKIGVGFTSPSNEIEVFGYAKLTDGTFALPVELGNSNLGGINFGAKTADSLNGNIAINKAVDANALSVEGDVIVEQAYTSLSGTLGQLSIGTGSPSMRIFDSGKVAIGNVASAPTTNLGVSGNIQLTRGSSLTSAVITGILTAPGFRFGPKDATTVIFESAATSVSETSVIKTDGTIGIKNNSPANTHKLQVPGKSTITGNLESYTANLNGLIIENGPGKGNVVLFPDGKMTINANTQPSTEKLLVQGMMESTKLVVTDSSTVSSVEFNKLTSGNPVRYNLHTLTVNSPDAQTASSNGKLLEVVGSVEGENFEVSRSTTAINNIGGIAIRADEGFISVGTPKTLDASGYFKATHGTKIFNVNGDTKVDDYSNLKLGGGLSHEAGAGIGIGTTPNPSYILSVVGNWKTTDDFCVRDKCLKNNDFLALTSVSGQTARFRGKNVGGSTGIFEVWGDGKISIGGQNDNPTEAMKITGSIKSFSNSGSSISGICAFPNGGSPKCARDFANPWIQKTGGVFKAKTQGNILFDGKGRVAINIADFTGFEADQAVAVDGNINVKTDFDVTSARTINKMGFQQAVGGWKMVATTAGQGLFITETGDISIGRTLPEHALHTQGKIIADSVKLANGFELADPSSFPLVTNGCGKYGFTYITDASGTIGIDEKGLLFVNEPATEINESAGLRIPSGSNIVLTGGADACVGNICLGETSGSFAKYKNGNDLEFYGNLLIDGVTGHLNKRPETVFSCTAASEDDIKDVVYNYSYFDEWISSKFIINKSTTSASNEQPCYAIGEIIVNSGQDLLICLKTEGSDTLPQGKWAPIGTA